MGGVGGRRGATHGAKAQLRPSREALATGSSEAPPGPQRERGRGAGSPAPPPSPCGGGSWFGPAAEEAGGGGGAQVSARLCLLPARPRPRSAAPGEATPAGPAPRR